MVLNLKITKGLNKVNNDVNSDEGLSLGDDHYASAVILRYFLIKYDNNCKSYDVFCEECGFQVNGGSKSIKHTRAIMLFIEIC